MTRQLSARERPLICRLGWHTWSHRLGEPGDRYYECPRRRLTAVTQPGLIRGAWVLLVGIGILALANAVIGLAVRRQFNPGVDDYLAAGSPEGPTMIAELSSALSYNVIGGLIAAMAVVPLALALRKPRPWARTATALGLGAHVLGLMVFLCRRPDVLRRARQRRIRCRPAALGQPCAGLVWAVLLHPRHSQTLALCVAAAVLFYRRSGGDYFADGVRGPREPLGVRTHMPHRVATNRA